MKLNVKFLGIILGTAAVLTLAGSAAWAQDQQARCGGTINWTSDTCFSIVPIAACKPGKKWDTKKIHADDYTPYKWTYGMSGADPVCFIQFNPHPEGQTAHDYYEKILKGALTAKGIGNLKVEKKVMNGRNVAYVTGYRPAEDSNMELWAWRNKEVGVNLQCFCVGGNCASVRSQFSNFANSVRFISEAGCL